MNACYNNEWMYTGIEIVKKSKNDDFEEIPMTCKKVCFYICLFNLFFKGSF